MGVSQTLISRWYVVRERVVMDGSRRLVPVGWNDALQVLKEKVAATATLRFPETGVKIRVQNARF